MKISILILLHTILTISCLSWTSAAYPALHKDKKSKQDGTFTIDYEGNTFLKDGEPFRYISGSIHYYRVPEYYWEDRLQKMYAAGLNAISIYIPWNLHEPSPGVYDFAGQNDVVRFIQLAQQHDLLVILRPGPYICAEWEFGGFPWWLLREGKDVDVRTSDPDYMEPAERWMNVFLQLMEPLLYQNGGPIIMVQVENEYSSYYTCDKNYTHHLRDIFRHNLGDEIVLFTCDAEYHFNRDCFIDDVYPTINFGSNVNATEKFGIMRQYVPNGPLVNSEYYSGWFDAWGWNHHATDTGELVQAMDEMLAMGGNVNIFMFHGGTNFGFWNGAPQENDICITSYDYDAPMSEAGDITAHYPAIRELIGKYRELPGVEIPPDVPKMGSITIQMELESTLWDALDTIAPQDPVSSQGPLSMEQVDQDFGFILYEHTLKRSFPMSVFEVMGIKDRGHVFLDQGYRGMLDRLGDRSFNMVAQQGQVVHILVENQGRINYGYFMTRNRKGITTPVTFDGEVLTDWNMYPLNLTKLFDGPSHRKDVKGFSAHTQTGAVPGVYASGFVLPDDPDMPMDTYLDMYGWSKGQLYINGYNLGRYWPSKGPQVTLYVPKGVLLPNPQTNHIKMFEVEYSPCADVEACHVDLVDTPVLNVTAIAHKPGVL